MVVLAGFSAFATPILHIDRFENDDWNANEEFYGEFPMYQVTETGHECHIHNLEHGMYWAYIIWKDQYLGPADATAWGNDCIQGEIRLDGRTAHHEVANIIDWGGQWACPLEFFVDEDGSCADICYDTAGSGLMTSCVTRPTPFEFVVNDLQLHVGEQESPAYEINSRYYNVLSHWEITAEASSDIVENVWNACFEGVSPGTCTATVSVFGMVAEINITVLDDTPTDNPEIIVPQFTQSIDLFGRPTTNSRLNITNGKISIR